MTLLDIVNLCVIKPGYSADNPFVIIKLCICRIKQGRGLWELNCSLLKNKDYIILVNNLINREKLAYLVMVCDPVNVATIFDSELV